MFFVYFEKESPLMPHIMEHTFTKILVTLNPDHVHAGTIQTGIYYGKHFDAPVIVAGTKENLTQYNSVIKENESSSGVNLVIHEIKDDNHKTIAEAVNKTGADLVIAPANKNTQKIVNDIDFPVLSITENFNNRPIRKIVMPLHDEPTTRQKIPYACGVAKNFGAEIYTIVVSSANEEEQSLLKSYAYQAEKYMSQHNVSHNYEITIGKKVEEETIEYAKKIDADLIIIMNDRDGGGFFGLALSDKMIRTSPIPLMIVEPKETNVSYARL